VTNLTDLIQASSISAWNFVAAPTVTSAESNNTNAVSGLAAGPIDGTGHTIDITGTGFAGSTVTIGGNACTGPVVAATLITCTAPDNTTAGAEDIVVTNEDTQAGTLSSGWTFQAAPTITTLTPTFGGETLTTALTINGTGFKNTISASTIKIDPGGTNADCTGVTFVSSTQLTCTAQAHAAGTVDIRVLNEDGQQVDKVSAFSYLPAPTISNVFETANGAGDQDVRATGGDQITVVGNNFIGGTTVTVNGASCTNLVVVSGTSITCDSPTTAPGTYAPVLVSGDTQTVTSGVSLIVRGAPTITNIEHNSFSGVAAGPIDGTGHSIKISGTNFYGTPVVTVGGNACTTVAGLTATEFTCTAPDNSGSGGAEVVDVVVTNQDSQAVTAANSWEFKAAPTFGSITAPTAAGGPLAGGTVLVIAGTNFFNDVDNPLTVVLDVAGTAAACAVSTNSATSVTCTTTAHVAATVAITITNSDGQLVTSGGVYSYNPAPTVTTALNAGDAFGDSSGTILITIAGTGFITGATVDIGGSTCTGPNVLSAISMQCTTAATGTHSLDDVVVTNPDGQTGTAIDGWQYTLAPTVTAVVGTAHGEAFGSNSDAVTLTGTNYFGTMVVTFDFGGGSAETCGSPTVINSTTLTCVLPGSHAAAGPLDVQVTNAIAQSNTGSNLWTYTAAPTITSVSAPSPAQGPLGGGTSITLTGTNFDTVSGNVGVTLGGLACTTVVVTNATTLSCDTPAQVLAGGFDIVVTNGDTQVSSPLTAGFTYIALPVLSSINPASDIPAGGSTVTLTGTDFTSGTTVAIGGTSCTAVAVTSATTITCTTGAVAAGTYDVVITDSVAQQSTLSNGFVYVSQPILQFQEGVASPNPPNPDPFGTTSTNITHTFTVQNVGDTISSSMSSSLVGANPGSWFIGTDTCSGNTLAASATCTIQATYLGLFVATGSYTADLQVTATSGGTDTNSMTGDTP
jgi:hypothetical protein